MSRILDIYTAPPPTLINMHRDARAGSIGKYDNQGRYCAPETEISFTALTDNIESMGKHMQDQWNNEIAVKAAIDEKFEEMERRIQDALALMHYTRQFYPHVIEEFGTAQKAKVRIGVEL